MGGDGGGIQAAARKILSARRGRFLPNCIAALTAGRSDPHIDAPAQAIEPLPQPN